MMRVARLRYVPAPVSGQSGGVTVQYPLLIPPGLNRLSFLFRYIRPRNCSYTGPPGVRALIREAAAALAVSTTEKEKRKKRNSAGHQTGCCT